MGEALLASSEARCQAFNENEDRDHFLSEVGFVIKEGLRGAGTSRRLHVY
jgi:hypothetical protein